MEDCTEPGCDGSCYWCDPPNGRFDKVYQFPIHISDRFWMIHESNPWCWCDPDEEYDIHGEPYYVHRERH